MVVEWGQITVLGFYLAPFHCALCSQISNTQGDICDGFAPPSISTAVLGFGRKLPCNVAILIIIIIISISLNSHGWPIRLVVQLELACAEA